MYPCQGACITLSTLGLILYMYIPLLKSRGLPSVYSKQGHFYSLTHTRISFIPVATPRLCNLLLYPHQEQYITFLTSGPGLPSILYPHLTRTTLLPKPISGLLSFLYIEQEDYNCYQIRNFPQISSIHIRTSMIPLPKPALKYYQSSTHTMIVLLLHPHLFFNPCKYWLVMQSTLNPRHECFYFSTLSIPASGLLSLLSSPAYIP